jgi:hypothetical protein
MALTILLPQQQFGHAFTVNLHDYGAIPVAGYWSQRICKLKGPLHLQVNGATGAVPMS